jgi:hypothetical protein
MTDANQSPLGTVVTIIDPFTLVINRGSTHGVKEGMRFLVYSLGEELYDPDTKESLGRLETVKGTGVVSHVQEKMSTIRSDMYKTEPGQVKVIERSGSLSFLQSGRERIEEGGRRVRLEFDTVVNGDKVKAI